MTVKKSTRGRASKRSASRALEPRASTEAAAVGMKKSDLEETEEAAPASRRARKSRVSSDLEEANAFASLEIQLRKTVAELGLDSARKIFASVEAAFAR
jgi:hypothetical protein